MCTAGLEESAGEGGRALLPRAVFWDMDGTLIDSEPYWHQVEIDLARRYGGRWDETLGWRMSGTPLPVVARVMRENGLQLPAEDVPALLIEGVARMEKEHMPWIEGARDLLSSLDRAGVPSVLVTTSPRRMARALVDQAPDGAFAAFVCGDDDLPKKPDPAPYLYAASLVGIEKGEMAQTVALEDSETGIRSAVESGATTLAFTGATPGDRRPGPEAASFDTYAGMTAVKLGGFLPGRSPLPRATR